MKGLRIYFDPESTEIRTPDVTFYSRRAGGPYYRWRYEEIRGQWLASRINVLELPSKEFRVAPWKGVPESLKSTLNEHYLE